MTAAAYIALTSLVVSVLTFVFLYLRPPKVSIFLGPMIILGYTQAGAGFSIQLPVTFFNKGAKSGKVFRTAILFHHQESPNQQYFMQWNTFLKLEYQQGIAHWVHEELAHALMIPANTNVSRLILFAWELMSPPFKMREGVYELEFFFWTDDSNPPRYETHTVFISSNDLATLEDRSNPEVLKSVTLQLDQQLETNQVKNQFDAQAVRQLPLKKRA